MQALRSLLLTLLVAMFAVGGVAPAMPAPAKAAEPPCREAPAWQEKSAPAPIR